MFLLLILALGILLLERESDADRKYRHREDLTREYQRSAALWAAGYERETVNAWLEFHLGWSQEEPQPLVRKWSRSPSVQIVGNPGPEHRTLIEGALQELEAHLGPLRFHKSPNGEPGDIQIFITPGLQFRKATGQGGGNHFRIVRWESSGALKSAQLHFDVARLGPDEFPPLLRRYLLESLGFPLQPTTGAFASVTTEPHRFSRFTDRDLQSLGMLYAPQLPVGILSTDLRTALAQEPFAP